MSIQVPTTDKEIKLIARELNKKQDFVCLDQTSHIKALLVAQGRLLLGKTVKAKIVKGY